MRCMRARSPSAGDYQLVEIGEDSIIVARTETGDIRAMHNICRHRGARVCEELSGNRKTYVCPYHGWVYNVDGSLKAARETHVMPDFCRRTRPEAREVRDVYGSGIH